MSDKMKLITGIGLAAMAGQLMGHAYPEPIYEETKESQKHKEYRAERRNKRRMQKKSKKANRT